MTRPRATPPDALLLFVTEPQQLDAVHEYGTETLSPDSIRVAHERVENERIEQAIRVDDEPERRECCSAHPWDDCEPDCVCPDCENDRAVDADADAYNDREV